MANRTQAEAVLAQAYDVGAAGSSDLQGSPITLTPSPGRKIVVVTCGLYLAGAAVTVTLACTGVSDVGIVVGGGWRDLDGVVFAGTVDNAVTITAGGAGVSGVLGYYEI